MLASKLSVCGRLPITAFVTGLSRPALSRPPTTPSFNVRCQMYARGTRAGVGRYAKRETQKDSATDTPFNIGRGFLAGSTALGIGAGALCFYGLSLSSSPGALDRSVAWPERVRQRIRHTYMYFGGGLTVTALAAVAARRSPAVMHFMMHNSILSIGATIVAMIGSGMVARSLPYREGFGAKQMAWLVHVGVMGAVIAPLTLFGGPMLVRAAWYTAGVVGGLSAVAVCAPIDKFINMTGVLRVGLGVVVFSSVCSVLYPPTAIRTYMYLINIYGGLVLCSLFLLFDTQRILKKAEEYPVHAKQPFDPINASLSVYTATLNIFLRIVMILAGLGLVIRKK